MMAMRLFLLLCLAGHISAKEPPEVDCLVVHLKEVRCFWNKQGIPEVNYTFSSRFSGDGEISCQSYLLENNTNIGCIQPYRSQQRFNTFYTKLEHGNKNYQSQHELKGKVLLNPPFNLTIQNGSDFNLWIYWNQTATPCVKSEVRIRINNKTWDISSVSTGKQIFCINLPSSNSRYELQVRSKFGNTCGESSLWSDWSEPAVWGSNNSTDINQIKIQMSVWTPVLYMLGAITLIILVMTLLHRERLRVILIPVVPSPSIKEDWFLPPKGLNRENFTANYIERTCTVREYCQVSQSDNESSDGSTCSVTTDQTDCSVSMPMNESEPGSTPCCSSSSTIIVSSEDEHGSV